MSTMNIKEEKRFTKMMEKANQLQKPTYMRKFLAPSFQLMIRAEAGASIGLVPVVIDGEFQHRFKGLGECRCVTCGKIGPWKGGSAAAGGGMNTGHFISSRCNSIVLEETNVAPQCAHCNLYLSGNQECYSTWMLHVHGRDEMDRLRRLRNEKRQFSKEEMVGLRIGFMDRLKAAEKTINQKGKS